ncbi:unnamed protein product [Cylicocyclus nassatus]|uniref:EGF-like domain-containing protein n=1 Tax=Cylicocyclus nassatus TaxID=53992 RepID=A0AA36H4B8_CYLNA|nr:unnamed protein product [Cylicocyclus nassatus]
MLALFMIICLLSVSQAAPGNETNELPTNVSKAAKKQAGESASAEKNMIEDVKKELDKAVKNLNNSVVDNNQKVTSAITEVAGSLTCTPVDCNNRGTCVGTKAAHICACNLGFSGSSCEETVCDSNRECNGRGICFGTTSSFTCLCNLGYSGTRCEIIQQTP